MTRRMSINHDVEGIKKKTDHNNNIYKRKQKRTMKTQDNHDNMIIAKDIASKFDDIVPLAC